MFTRNLLSTAFLLSLSVLASFAGTPDSTSLIITTKQGQLRGTTDNGVHVWRGVRYAQAPIGNLRFKVAQPLQSWDGVKNAIEFGAIAPQIENSMGGEGDQSEDCLFLNVWSQNSADTKKPVMFWIHGGGFVMGSGSSDMYNGSPLCKNGVVVVVTINYRLGPLGFMFLENYNTDSVQYPSNLGLYDMVEALKWANENIAAFGGDPNNITIFGESAGANSVLALLTSPHAKGLFQKAIVQSAANLSIIDKEKAAAQTKEYLQILGIDQSNIAKLNTLSVDTLLAAGEKYFRKKVADKDDVMFFLPVAGTDFLPLTPAEAIAKGEAIGIAIMIGTNRDEANLFAKLKPVIIEPNEVTVNNYINRSGLSNHSQHILSLYPGYPSRSTILAMITDAIFQVPSIYIAGAQSNYASVYSYRFDWTSFPIRLSGLGACHGMELPFVFSTFKSGAGKRIMKASANGRVHRLSKKMQEAWLSFAKTGTPGNNWPVYTTEKRSTMIFDNNMQVVSDPASKQRVGWEVVQ